MRRLVTTFVVATGLASCGFSGVVPDTTVITCAGDHDCPPGQVCAPRIAQCVVAIDDEPPQLASLASTSSTTVIATMSEAVKPDSVAIADVEITPTLTVIAVSLADDQQTVRIVTEPQSPGTQYALTLSAITDTGGNVIDAAGASGNFTGFGTAPETDAPPPISPADHQVVYGGQARLVWLARVGAASYVVEVATDASFNAPLSGSPFTVLGDTRLDLTGLADITYYWRVRSDITNADAMAEVWDFDVLIDTIYVSCAMADDCAAVVIANGSKTRPYRRIADAAAAAPLFTAATGVAMPAVDVAARGGGVAYDESVFITAQSLSLLGGFSSDFATRDVAANVTAIGNDLSALTIERVTAPVRVDGFSLIGTGTNGTALSVAASSSALIVSNCALSLADGNTAATLVVGGGPANGAVFDTCAITAPARPVASTLRDTTVLITQSAVTLRNCLVSGINAQNKNATTVEVLGPLPGELLLDTVTVIAAKSMGGWSYGLEARTNGIADSAGTLHVVDSTIIASDAVDISTAAKIDDVPTIVERSRLQGGSGAAATGEESAGVYMAGGSAGASLTVIDSIVAGGVPISGGSVGISLQAGTASIIHSVVIGGGTGATALECATDALVIDSILFNWAGNGGCMREVSRPRTFDNNVLLSCSDAPYTYGATYTVVTTSGGLNALDGTVMASATCGGSGQPVCPHARFSGNVISASSITATFTDADGPDNNAYTITDNAPKPKPASTLVNSGKPTSDNDCGTVETPQSCGNVTVDIDKAPRTAPVSIGAYEVDP